MLKAVLNINEQNYETDIDDNIPLLWVLRDQLNLTGTKYGCGIGVCGACMVLVNGEPIQSCSLPASSCVDKKIITIEGLSVDDMSRIQQAWIDEQVPQCGYCQSGQIIVATAMLKKYDNPTKEQVNAYMSRVLCRCGTYPRIEKAIESLTGNKT